MFGKNICTFEIIDNYISFLKRPQHDTGHLECPPFWTKYRSWKRVLFFKSKQITVFVLKSNVSTLVMASSILSILKIKMSTLTKYSSVYQDLIQSSPCLLSCRKKRENINVAITVYAHLPAHGNTRLRLTMTALLCLTLSNRCSSRQIWRNMFALRTIGFKDSVKF